MLFHKRLTEGWQNVSSETYNLSIDLQIQFPMLTLTDLYPNVHVILKLLLANIISRFLYICAGICERSFSALRRFRTWRRATMTEDRLCGLAMIHVHRNDTVGQVIPEAVSKDGIEWQEENPFCIYRLSNVI